MKKHPVVICSNLINRYGFRILASGIKLGAYSKNPIVLYAHQRPSKENPKIMPIGKMSDIQIDESGQLVGQMEFDQDDSFAVSVEKKWEKGMLNAVSLRAEVLRYSDEDQDKLPNQVLPTIVECLLEEISVEPIPGDSNAVSLRLHYKGQPAQVISLSDDSDFDPSKLFPTKQKSEMSKLIQLALQGQKHVTLAKDASEDEQVKCITELIGVADKTVELKADLSKKEAEIIQLKQDNEALKNAAVDEKAEALVQLAVDAKKITPAQKAEYVTLAKTNYDSVKNILDSMKGFTSLSKETPEESKDEKFVSLSWDELDKKNLLAELKASNKDLYDEKFEARFGRKPQS